MHRSTILVEAPAVTPPSGPPVTTGLVVWLDASQLTGADGSSVDSWPNLGSGSTPSAIWGPTPMVLKTNALNSKSIVRFSANGVRLRGTHGITLDYTILYITRRWGTNGGRAVSGVYPPTSNTNFLLGFWTSAYDCMYDGGWVNTGTPWNQNDSSYLANPSPWKLYGAAGASSGGYASRFFINGVLSGSMAGGTGLGGVYSLSGSTDPNPDETMDCDIAECLVYDHNLTDPERVQVENYLRTKWGMT